MTIRVGSRGEEVRSFQQFLIRLGFLDAGQDDGVVGPRSAAAIAEYQAASGLVVDQVAGPQTLDTARHDGWVYEEGPSQAQIDAANELGLPIEVIQTIEAVESGGRASSVRFEVHVFNRLRPDLKGQLPFTPGPRGYSVTRSETDRGAFERAFALDPVAATKSTSFGLYQVLGGHLLKLHNTPESGVDNFYARPVETSYKLLVSWFKDSDRALKAARAKDWAKFARYYNGPGQVEYYKKALEREYLKVTS